MGDDAGMLRRRTFVLLASSMLSVGLALAVNVVTGGTLPGPLGEPWLAWPLVALLAGATAGLAAFQDEDGPGPHRAPADPPAPGRIRPAELPPDVTRFAGRQDDLEALLAAVPGRPVPGLGAPVVLGVFGAGGTGKSVLTTRLAHEVAGRYPDGQVFVELRGASPEPVDPHEVMRRVLHAFGVAAADVPEDPGARQALYRSVLADRRVLLYLDDAGADEQVRPLLPAARGCLVLVTARPSLLGSGLTAWRDLGALSDEAALAVLRVAVAGHARGTPGAGGPGPAADRLAAETEATAEVVRLCGRLPLALGIAGARLRSRPQWRVADLAARLADERRRLDELHAGGNDVRASIASSYAELAPETARTFRLLSLAGYASFGPGVAGALLGGEEPWRRSEVELERLADAKLVEIAGPRRYRFHDLVRLFAAERLAAEEPEAERRAALRRSLGYYVERTEEQWRALASAGAGDDPGIERGSTAPELWFDRTRPAIVAAVRRAAEAGEPATAIRLAAVAAPYLETRGYPVDLAAVSEVAIAEARRTGDRPGLANALRNLGQAERHRSRHDRALAAFTECLAVRRELGDDARVAEALRRVGDTHRETGRYPEAEDAYQRSIAAYLGLGMTDAAALVESALASTWLLDGRVAEATELIERAVATLRVDERQVPGGRARAWALETLGATRRANGQPEAAEDCHRRSLASFRDRGERYGAACALVNLGWCAADRDRPDEARRHFGDAMRLFTEMGNTDGQDDARGGLAALPPAARRDRVR
jgi:tetratricopeptide (TPR) repeat protein